MSDKKKLVLAFSGGLDTCFATVFLREQSYDVITATVDTGGFSNNELKNIKKLSKKLGAIKHFELNVKNELYDDFVSYIVKSNYKRLGVYPTVVGGERGLQAKKIAEVARNENAVAVAHGSTGAGNDQIRFDVVIRAFAGDIKIIAPTREHNFSRQYEADFLQKRGFNFDSSRTKYSINVGLLGVTIGGGETLDVKTTVDHDKLYDEIIKELNINKSSKSHNDIVQKSHKISFENGLPVSLDGKKMSGIKIISELNKIAYEHHFGFKAYIGSTIIGLKSRICFLAPALEILIKSHYELEKVVLTSKQIFWKDTISKVYGDLIHQGLFFEPLVDDIKAFLDSSNRVVSGVIEFEILENKLQIKNINSKYSLFDTKKYLYGETVELWSGQDAEGFCKIFGTESVLAFLKKHQ